MADALSPNLIERLEGFSYGYRMRCECGESVEVSAQTYFREQVKEARVPCGHCCGSVHFGPAMAMLRDEHDRALDNAVVSEFAWYHTSTWADWPSDNFVVEAKLDAPRAAQDYGIDPVSYVKHVATKALHVGTYEAAIENMLRRMDDEGDGDKQFYLYRVELTVEPSRINVGYRDENAEEAALVTLADLDAANVDVLRYLNVHEAVGSLSLAIRPTCIAGVQRLAIPVAEFGTQLGPDLLNRLDRLESQQGELDAQTAVLPNPSAYERIMIRIGTLPESPGLLDRLGELETAERAIQDERVRHLTEYYLANISPVVADALTMAISPERNNRSAAHRSTYIDQFAITAALLTRQREVVEMVAQQPWHRALRCETASLANGQTGLIGDE